MCVLGLLSASRLSFVIVFKVSVFTSTQDLRLVVIHPLVQLNKYFMFLETYLVDFVALGRSTCAQAEIFESPAVEEQCVHSQPVCAAHFPCGLWTPTVNKHLYPRHKHVPIFNLHCLH